MRVFVGIVGLLLAGVGIVHAQAYPTKPVRIIVGFAAGGPSDIVARLLAQQLTERLGRSVIVENRPGATGTIGADLVGKAPPDGHTLYLASQTTHAVAPYMYKNVGYDPVNSFATVTLAMQNPLLGVVHPSMQVRSVKDLIALARARPGEINFATGGQGSSPHMSVELLKSMAKINMVPVHYKGDGAAIPEVMGGQVPLMFASIAGWLPYAQAGRVRAIAVTSLKRSSIAPEILTVAESGLPGFEVITWFGILATAGTPKDVIGRLNQELVRSLASPAVKEQAAKLGMEIVGSSADEYGAFLKAENAKWGKMVKDLGLRAD
jgi:tripartite-type tricarboxylate transporter receptor subunit TctC